MLLFIESFIDYSMENCDDSFNDINGYGSYYTSNIRIRKLIH